jgi:hypothetical protein
MNTAWDYHVFIGREKSQRGEHFRQNPHTCDDKQCAHKARNSESMLNSDCTLG